MIWIIHFNGKKRYSYVSPVKSMKLLYWRHWKSTSEFSVQGTETEITQTLGSFVLRGVQAPNWIPDTAVCPCPGEITDAGGFITAHLWRTKNRDAPFSLHLVVINVKGTWNKAEALKPILKKFPMVLNTRQGETMYRSNSWMMVFFS